MNLKTLNIRADASPAMGAGHVMRCIALGQAFKNKGGRVHFLTGCQNPSLLSRLAKEGFEVSSVSGSPGGKKDLEQTLEILGMHRSGPSPARSFTVVDGYQFPPSFHRAVREAGHRLLVIDDDNHLDCYHCHILLNPSARPHTIAYRTHPQTLCLEGLEYALIREEFSGARPPEPLGNPARILVTMGGSDPAGACLTILGALKRIQTDNIRVKAIIGPMAGHASDIKALVRASNAFEAIESPDMASLMHWADLALSAASTTCLELGRMGVPFIMVTTAPNQAVLADNLAKQGMGIHMGQIETLGEDAVACRVSALLESPEKLSAMAGRAMAMIDGKGPERIIRQMERLD